MAEPSYELARRHGRAEAIAAVIAAVAEVYPDAAEWLASDEGDDAIRRALEHLAALDARKG